MRELVAAKKAELEAQLLALDTLDIEALLRERGEAADRLARLDDQIAQVRSQLGVPAPAPVGGNGSQSPSGGGDARSRMSSEEVNRRIMGLLENNRDGLSQLQIAESAALAYGTVAAYLKTNSGRFQITGHLKGKRYFLK